MARTFTITCAAGTIRLAGEARGECTFTVTNTSAAVVRAHPTVVALDGRAENWFGVVGNPVRELAPGQTVQITVNIMPVGAPPGRYSFRLDMLPAEGGERSSGPEACVELTSEAAPLPVGRKPFPWWWLVIAAVVLVIIGVVLWLVFRGGGSAPVAAPTEESAITEPVKLTDDVKPSSSAQPLVKDGDVQELVEQWLVAFRKKNPKALTNLTVAPAVIDGQRANDAGTIYKLYSALLEQDRSSATRLSTATKPAKPVMARVKDIRTRLPREAKDIGLADDDHAVGVTVEESGLKLVLFIRQGSPPHISGVMR